MDQYQTFLLAEAKDNLRMARDRKDDLDVSFYVEDIRKLCDGFTLADVGTSEDELKELIQTGYVSEARTCLCIARGMYGHSRPYLYARAVRNIGGSFLRNPNLYWFKSLLETFFCLRHRTTHQYYIACVKKYLTIANIHPEDIGSDSSELIKLGN